MTTIIYVKYKKYTIIKKKTDELNLIKYTSS